MLGSVSKRERDAKCYSGDVPDTTPAFVRASRVRRCQRILHARHSVLLATPILLSQWTPSRFTVEGISFSCGEHFFAAEKSRLFGDHQTSQHVMRVSDPRLHKQYGTEVHNFDLDVWERERENIVCVDSYAKFAQNPAMQSHFLDTGDRLLAEASPYDLVWGIGYRVDHVSPYCVA